MKYSILIALAAIFLCVSTAVMGAVVWGDTITTSVVLTGNLSGTGNGLIVGASNITIDGGGYSLTGDGASCGIRDTAYTHVVIKNFSNISHFDYGVWGCEMDNSSITDCTLTGNGLTEIERLGCAIYLTSSTLDTITNNSAIGNSTGLNLDNLTKLVATGNSVDDTHSILALSSATSYPYGIRLSHVQQSRFVSNTIRDGGGDGIYAESSSINDTLTANTISHNFGYAWRWVNTTGTNVFASNIIAMNALDISDGGTSKYTNNQILYNLNLNSKMLIFTDFIRSRAVDATFTAHLAMFTISGANGATDTYTVETIPSETVTTGAVSNALTSVFTVTRQGTYSLLYTITDVNGNITKKNYLLFIGATEADPITYYIRPIPPTHGQPLGSLFDSGAYLFALPSGTEIDYCYAWVQTGPDTIPDYPLSYVTGINTHTNYSSEAAGSLGLQRFCTYSNAKDTSVVMASTSGVYTTLDQNIASLRWGMDYPQSWYLLTMKLIAQNIYQRTTVADPSYSIITRSHTTTPGIKTVSNSNLIMLSATTQAGNANAYSIIVNNPLSTAQTLTLTLAGLVPVTRYEVRLNGNIVVNCASDPSGVGRVALSGISSTATIDMAVAPLGSHLHRYLMRRR